MNIIKYTHFDKEVSTFEETKGKHRGYCLCWCNCEKFKPNTPENCEIAQTNYAMCVKYNLVTPIFECPEYKRKEKN